MKKTIILFLMFLAALTMAYLVGSFIEASFDIKVWSEFWRAFVGIFGTLGASLAVLAASELDIK